MVNTMDVIAPESTKPDELLPVITAAAAFPFHVSWRVELSHDQPVEVSKLSKFE